VVEAGLSAEIGFCARKDESDNSNVVEEDGVSQRGTFDGNGPNGVQKMDILLKKTERPSLTP